MAYKDVGDCGRVASRSNEQAHDIQPTPRVEKDPPRARSLAPLDEQTGLMPRLVRGPASSQQSNTHPRSQALLAIGHLARAQALAPLPPGCQSRGELSPAVSKRPPRRS